MTNEEIASRLEEVASLLAEQDANPYRIRAYRNAADLIRGLGQSVEEMVQSGGIEVLDDLPGIGEGLARSIYLMVRTGRLPMLERLRGESDPVTLLRPCRGSAEHWRVAFTSS